MSSWFAAALSFNWFAPPRREAGGGRSGGKAQTQSDPLPKPFQLDDRRTCTLIDGADSATIVDRIRNGDPAMLGALYLHLFDRLWRFASTISGSKAHAEELVQDVFLSLWERRATLTLREDIATYLFTAVRNRAVTSGRHERVVRQTEALTQGREELVPALGSRVEAPDEAALAAELRQAVHSALSALSERERAALLLRWDEGQTYDEIGRALGVSAMGAHKMVNRALHTIRPLVERFRDRSSG